MKRGFTLVELLVVIAVIGVLSSVVIASLNQARIKGRDAERKQELHELATAINNYYADNGRLPRNSTGWCTYVTNATGGYGAGFASDLVPRYISKIPSDPVTSNQVGDYFYFNLANTAGRFHVCANLEQATGATYNYAGCDGGTVYNYCTGSN